MIPDVLIIITVFVVQLIPVATVVAFFRLDSNPDTAHLLPELDSYYLPDEQPPKLLPPGQPPMLPPHTDGDI